MFGSHENHSAINQTVASITNDPASNGFLVSNDQGLIWRVDQDGNTHLSSVSASFTQQRHWQSQLKQILDQRSDYAYQNQMGGFSHKTMGDAPLLTAKLWQLDAAVGSHVTIASAEQWIKAHSDANDASYVGAFAVNTLDFFRRRHRQYSSIFNGC